MKIFISQPMSNRTNEQILNERNCIVYKIDKQINTPYEIIDSFFDEVYHNENPLFYLGKSIELMSQADLVYYLAGHSAHHRGHAFAENRFHYGRGL